MSIFKTERLVLRPFQNGDETAVYKNWTSNERIAKYMKLSPHSSIEETKETVSKWLDDYENGLDFRWGLALKNNDEVIGIIDVVNIYDGGTTAEICFILGYDYLGKGYMTEACSSVVKFLLSNGFTKVKADHKLDNPFSGFVINKSGMKFLQLDKL